MSLDGGRKLPADDKEWFRWCFQQTVRRRIVKKTDETRDTDTTFAADSELALSLKANDFLTARVVVYFDTGATPDFKIKFSYSGTSSAFNFVGLNTPAGLTTASAFAIKSLATSQSIIGAGTGEGLVTGDLRLVTTGDGVFSVDWAQVTSDAADTTVQGGSFIEYEIL